MQSPADENDGGGTHEYSSESIIQVINMLLDAGANVNDRDNNGNTALQTIFRRNK